MGWLEIWRYLVKEESYLSHKVLWEVNNVGCPTLSRTPCPWSSPRPFPTRWVSHLARSPTNLGSQNGICLPSWSRPALFNKDNVNQLYTLKKKIIYLFLATLGLRCCARTSLVAVSGGYSSLRCAGFSLRWLLLLQSTGSRVHGLQ